MLREQPLAGSRHKMSSASRRSRTLCCRAMQGSVWQFFNPVPLRRSGAAALTVTLDSEVKQSRSRFRLATSTWKPVDSRIAIDGLKRAYVLHNFYHVAIFISSYQRLCVCSVSKKIFINNGDEISPFYFAYFSAAEVGNVRNLSY